MCVRKSAPELLLRGLRRLLCGHIREIVGAGGVVVLVLQLLDLLDHDDQADHVQDDDHAHEAVSDHVHDLNIGERAGNGDEDRIHEHPEPGELLAEENLGLDLTEEAGGDDRREDEEEHGEGDEDRAEAAEDGLERRKSELAAFQTLLRPHAGAEDGKGGDGADHDGVGEDLEDAELRLTDGVIGIGSAVTGNGGADAGFVGVHAAGGAPADRHHNGRPGKAAGRGMTGEGILEDEADHLGQRTDVGKDDNEGAENVDRKNLFFQLLLFGNKDY